MHWLDVKGQIRAMRLLQMAFAAGRMPHAWLFHGPAGIGKEMLAVRFARLLLCEQPVTVEPPAAAGVEGAWQDACGRCRSCHLVESGTHPDLHLIYRELNKNHPDPAVQGRKALEISVDVARHFLLEPVRGRAAMGRAKVYIVRDAELLSIQAQNALLKTLEEPPEDTYIILLSTAKDRMLPTTISRCQSVALAPLVTEETRRILVGCGMAADDAGFYGWLSQGRPGWAMRLAQYDLRKDYPGIAEELARIGSADPLDVAARWAETAQRWAKGSAEEESSADPSTDAQRQALNVLFVVLSSLLREGLRTGAAGLGQSGPAESSKSVADLAHWNQEGLAQGVREVASAESAIARNAAPPLTLEALSVKLARICRGRPAGPVDVVSGGR